MEVNGVRGGKLIFWQLIFGQLNSYANIAVITWSTWSRNLQLCIAKTPAETSTFLQKSSAVAEFRTRDRLRPKRVWWPLGYQCQQLGVKL